MWKRAEWKMWAVVGVWLALLPRVVVTLEADGERVHWQVRALWDAGALLGLGW